MRAHPVGHELAGHDEIKRAAVGIEGPELRGLQPAVEGASAKIAAKSHANRFPGRLERCGNQPGWLNIRIRNDPLHLSAPPSSNPPWQKGSAAPDPSRALNASFLSCPRRGFAPG